MRYIELSEEELTESMGYGSERAGEHEFATRGSTAPKGNSKYHVKLKKTGKIISTHSNAPDAVRARAKIGSADTHSIIKEDHMAATKDLINAIVSGKTTEIDAAFNEVFATKVTNALDNFKLDVASNLFVNQTQEAVEQVKEAVLPGSVHKDKNGNVLSAKTVPDKKPWSKENILGKSMAQHWADTGKAVHPKKKD